jgi:hypothetical protein
MKEDRKSSNWSEFYSEFINRNIGLVSVEEQERIRTAKVAVLGVGGLGGPLAEQLVRTGCESLSICDNGKFEISNLNRQICFEKDVGKYKIDVTETRLKKINPNIKVIKSRRFDSSNTSALLKEASIAVLTLDDPIISIAIARECFRRKIPLLESWGIPFLWAWWFTAENLDYETCYGFKTGKLTVDEIINSPEIVFDIKVKILDKLRQFPEVQERYNREKGTIQGIASGKLPFVAIAPVVRITASYLAYEVIYTGIIKAKRMVLAPTVIGYDYFNMKEINLE